MPRFLQPPPAIPQKWQGEILPWSPQREHSHADPLIQIVVVCYSSPALGNQYGWPEGKCMLGLPLKSFHLNMSDRWGNGPRFVHGAVGSGQSSSHTVEDRVRVRTGGSLVSSSAQWTRLLLNVTKQNEPSAQHGFPGLHDTTHPAGVLQGLCEGASSLGRHHCPPPQHSAPSPGRLRSKQTKFQMSSRLHRLHFFHAVGSVLAGMSIFCAAMHWKGFHVKRCQVWN